jgi:hypothetical protein
LLLLLCLYLFVLKVYSLWVGYYMFCVLNIFNKSVSGSFICSHFFFWLLLCFFRIPFCLLASLNLVLRKSLK